MSARNNLLGLQYESFPAPLGPFLAFFILFLSPLPAVAGMPVIPHAGTEITVDGHLDEAAWSQALFLSLPYETSPSDNGPAPVRTEAFLFHSDTHLHVGFRAYDPEPDRIRARFRERSDIFGHDMVSITLDPYDGQRRGYQFLVNPLGVQADLFINELAGTEDSSFEAIWHSAGRLTDFGYVVEIAIPFSSLRFPDQADGMTWGLDLVRFYPRDYRRRFALSPLERGQECYLCQIRRVTGFGGARSGRALEITPEFSLVGREVPSQNEGELQRDSNIGGTAQWAITPGLTLTGTVNPDFSHVAADPLQLDINQPFGIQHEEQRPFFQESADIFQTPMEAVQTRNMIEPASGIKLAGQVGSQAIGLFHVRDRQLNLIRPGVESAEFERLDQWSESTALRYRRDVLDDSGMGLLVTHRLAEDYENSLIALDGQLRLSDRDTLRYQWAHSDTHDDLREDDTDDTDEPTQTGDARRIQYQHERRHVYLGGRHEQRDPGFRADLGFMPQTGFLENRAWLGTRWFGEGQGLLQQAGVHMESSESEAVADGRPLARQDVLRFQFDGARQSRLILYGQQHERWHGGRYFDGHRWLTYFQVEPFAGLSLQAEASGGQQIDFVGLRDGRSRRIAPGINMEIGRHVALNLNYQREHLDIPDGRLFTATTRELRAGWYFGVRTYLRLVSQWADIDRDASLYPDGLGGNEVSWANQLTFTWRLDPRTEFIAGYSDRHSGETRDQLELEGRRVFLKMSYSWQI